MRCQFDILSVESSDTSRHPVIVLSYDDKKYLFNCGEGTQRQMLAQKVPMRKVREIFTTSGWESYGGLGGLLLGITSTEAELSLGIHGPRNIARYLASLRAGQQRGYRYTEQKSLVIEEYHEALPKAFEDPNVIVQPIITLPTDFDIDKPGLKSTTRRSPRRGSLTQQELQDPVRVANIAHSVWSGQFLEKQADGTWASPAAATKTCRPSNQTEALTSAKRARSRPDPQGDQTRFKKRMIDNGNVQSSRPEDPAPRPTSEKYRAFSQYMSEDLPPCDPFPAAVSYFIQGQPLPGKFDPIRAKALGVPAGPDFGRLQKGHRVVTPSGHEVKSEDVMGPVRTIPPVLLVDCPSLNYIDNLCNHSFWKTCTKDRQPVVVVHSCGSNVLNDKRYISFMSSFGINVKHFIANGDYVTDSLTNTVAATQMDKLRLLSSSIYPLPHHEKQPKDSDLEMFYENALNASAIENKVQFNPFPYLAITRKEELPQSVLSKEHAELLEEYSSQCKQTQELIKTLGDGRDDSFAGALVEIATLGTGSAGPSNFRNVAATLIMIPDSFSILLDCGENTIGQFRRLHGSDTSNELRRVKLIIISHMHADHHLGLIGFLRAWRTHHDRGAKLFVVCSANYARSITEYSSIEDIGVEDVVFLDSGRHTKTLGETSRDGLDQQGNWQQLRTALPEISNIVLVPAIHCDGAFCVRINHVQGWSVAYSGDTRPCPNFASIGNGVTCLIHEATFEDDLLDEAVKKKHSTIGEALRIAQDMKARTTILTHFSQRYSKLPNLRSIDPKDLSVRQVGVASDLMRIRIKDIWQLSHHLVPQIYLAEGLEKLNIKDLDQEQEETVVVDGCELHEPFI